MTTEKTHLELCNLSLVQYDQIKVLMDEAYPELGGAWPQHTIERLIDEFPEGQIGVIDGEVLVGIALSVQVDYKRFSNPHTYEDIVGPNDVISSNG
ncbi:MAG: hydrolase, partial [Thalassolituus sp.]